jgi:exodeoxyribonuclease VII small subunit
LENENFEEKLESAKKILEKLMDPQITLEDGVKFYKEGIKELDEATKLLESAKLTIKDYQKSEEE